MAHFAHLTGCPDRAAAERNDLKALWAAPGPELTARYSIPLFWLAGLDHADEVQTVFPAGGPPEEAMDLSVWCASAKSFVARLEQRRDAVLALLPPAMALYYDEWLRFVRSRYTQSLLLRTEDLFGMEGYEESAARLRAAIDAIRVADSGRPIRQTAPIEWFAACLTMFAERAHAEPPEDTAARWRERLTGSTWTEQGSLLWPTRPQSPEVELAAQLPEAAEPAPVGSAAARDQALTTLIREGRRPTDVASRMKLAFDKLAGDAPLGIDAPNKTVRKWIGGSGALLGVVRYAFLGMMLSLAGAAMVWFGLRVGFNGQMAGIGALLLAGGLWCDWQFVRSLRELRAILRA